MQAKPIIFNGDMVRAILDGRKTQTRRVVKPQPPAHMHHVDGVFTDKTGKSLVRFFTENSTAEHKQQLALCPHGQPGDLLWVRETLSIPGGYMDEDLVGEVREGLIGLDDLGICFRADAPESVPADGGWTPSIHMPRWASRITLEITGVRVERLQDISDEDAKSEGCDNSRSDAAQNVGWYENPRKAFARLWGSIYGDWDANPWVWVIEFKPHLKNVDDLLNG